MTTIGFIGSGRIGSTVARLAVGAGHDVVLSNSRGPETLRELAAELGPRAKAGTYEGAAAAVDLVLLSIPLNASPRRSGAPLAGQLPLYPVNYHPNRAHPYPEL